MRSAFNFLFNCCSRLPLPHAHHTLTCTHLPHTHAHTHTPLLATHTQKLCCHLPHTFADTCRLRFVSFSFLCFSFAALITLSLSLFYFEFPSQNFVLVFYVNLYKLCCCCLCLPHGACCIRQHVASCWKTLRVLRRQMRRDVGRGVGQKHTKPGTHTYTQRQKGHTHTWGTHLAKQTDCGRLQVLRKTADSLAGFHVSHVCICSVNFFNGELA